MKTPSQFFTTLENMSHELVLHPIIPPHHPKPAHEIGRREEEMRGRRFPETLGSIKL